jgi:hypothetical protein
MARDRGLQTLGYVLLLAATVPHLVHGSGWALLPVAVVLTSYVSAVIKASARDDATAKAFEELWLLCIAFYYVLCLVWPCTLHWYDALAIAGLFSTPHSSLSVGFFAAFYAASTVHYAGKGDALQVCGRSLLTMVTAAELARVTRDEAARERGAAPAH